jgi:hypothetical protein
MSSVAANMHVIGHLPAHLEFSHTLAVPGQFVSGINFDRDVCWPLLWISMGPLIFEREINLHQKRCGVEGWLTGFGSCLKGKRELVAVFSQPADGDPGIQCC